MGPKFGTASGPSEPVKVVRRDYHIRLSDEERMEFDKVAKEEGFTSAAAWLRVLGKRRVEERRFLRESQPTIQRFFREVK